MEVEDVLTYRSSGKQSSSDSDSDDSQKDFVWKRAGKSSTQIPSSQVKVLVEPPVAAAPQTNGSSQSLLIQPLSRKRKANNIWSTVLEDQIMSETFKDCGLRTKPADANLRSVESYDYTLKYSDPRNNYACDDRIPSDERLCDETNYSNSRHAKRFKTNSKHVDLDSSGAAAAKKIVRVLNEQKHYLIYRIVKIIGEEKALKLLKMTEDVEDNGGMMIKNNARRRTPGGVYLQLLKSDKSITKEQVDQVFEGEGNEFVKFFKEQREKKKKKKSSENVNKVESMELQTAEPNNEPPPEVLTTQTEISKKPESPFQLAEAIKTNCEELEEGEIDD